MIWRIIVTIIINANISYFFDNNKYYHHTHIGRKGNYFVVDKLLITQMITSNPDSTRSPEKVLEIFSRCRDVLKISLGCLAEICAVWEEYRENYKMTISQHFLYEKIFSSSIVSTLSFTPVLSRRYNCLVTQYIEIVSSYLMGFLERKE